MHHPQSHHRVDRSLNMGSQVLFDDISIQGEAYCVSGTDAQRLDVYLRKIDALREASR